MYLFRAARNLVSKESFIKAPVISINMCFYFTINQKKMQGEQQPLSIQLLFEYPKGFPLNAGYLNLADAQDGGGLLLGQAMEVP